MKPSKKIASMTNRMLFTAPFVVVAVIATENGIFSSRELVMSLGGFIVMAAVAWLVAAYIERL